MHPDTNTLPGKVTRNCGVCGSEFFIYRSRLLNKKGRGQYCSKPCSVQALRDSMPSLEERFWSRIRKTKTCWLWTGNTAKGYGRLTQTVNGRSVPVQAHKLSYEIHKGKVPAGLWVLHRCDNPPCVNPDHLFLGTALENTQDMISKGRKSRGEQSNHSGLTAAAVNAIREEYASGEALQVELAAKHGVSQHAISSIVRRKTWTHV